MKVFISWSGNISHSVAVVLRDWLPSVIQSIQPYVSSEDIDKGARWSTDIADELHASTYGLICLTKDNITASWINFEAGALGKSIDKSRVSPFLFRLKRSEVEGPLLQFQSTVFERDDVLKLLQSINSACGSDKLDDVRLEKTFDVWWPQLEKLLSEIKEEVYNQEPETGSTESSPTETASKLLEEILELTRNNHKILRDPMSLLPPDYIQHVLHRSPRRDYRDLEMHGYEVEINQGLIRELVERYRDVLKFISSQEYEFDRSPAYVELHALLRRMDEPLRYISKELGLRLPREVLSEK